MRSMLAFWMGGASVTNAATAGYTGFLAFWMGGGSPSNGEPQASEWIIKARRRGRR